MLLSSPLVLSSPPRLAFVAAPTPDAQAALADLRRSHASVPVSEATVVVALGGDGFMLETIHAGLAGDIPVFGMNRGSVGFLMNEYHSENLPLRLAAAQAVRLHPLHMRAVTTGGQVIEAAAFNEVSLLRETRQAAKFRVLVDGVLRMNELVCDGLIVTTPAGSTAYNLSANGPILPLGCDLLALTPLSPFRPRRWRGALLPHRAQVTLEILEADKRPVSAVADFTEARDVARVEIMENRNIARTLLFDPEHNLEERILKEQFLT
jgi:NAD+ kinase